MGDISYKPLIDDMTWSFSRIETFDSCKYKWFLKYIKEKEEDGMFYSDYGKLIHKIIQMYYSGELKQPQMTSYFLTHFSAVVRGDRPADSTLQKYIQSGIDYTRNFRPFEYNCVGTEVKAEFELGGYRFIGFIDFIGEKDGEYYVIDHKSRDLKPRSGRANPTVKDRELDSMLKQLYLYSTYIKDRFGKFPKALCFNCFKNGEFITEDFSKQSYDKAVEWAVDRIHQIEQEEDFISDEDLFKCRWLCGYNEECEYYQNFLEEWRRNRD